MRYKITDFLQERILWVYMYSSTLSMAFSSVNNNLLKFSAKIMDKMTIAKILLYFCLRQ